MIKTFPTLYSRAKTGNVLEWFAEINPDNPSQYRVVTGTQNGKKVTSTWKSAEPKNTGKKNQRTAEEQAIFEVESMYEKRLKTSYYSDITEIDIPKFIEPMLAEKYKSVDFQTVSYVFSQPKLDGVRAVVSSKGITTRNGENIISCDHIIRELKPYTDLGFVFDGELYNHDYKDDFNTIVGSVKKKILTDKERQEIESIVQFHCYDIVDISKTFADRFVCGFVFGYLKDNTIVKRVKTTMCTEQKTIDSLYEEYMEDGYEGQMIRLDSKYEHCRSKSLLKRKEWTDSEFELIAFEEGKGNWSGKAKKGIFKIPDDWYVQEGESRTFKAGIKGNREYCEHLLKHKDKYIGKMCTVIYAPQLTPAGKPRFGRVKEFDRNDI